MVVCKYFLQGTCRFGENCKFEHQISADHSYAGSQSVLVQNYANKPAPQNASTAVDTNTLVKAVVNDMTCAEKGGQWLLSSYSPFRDKPQFPGFEDHSMEEIRYLFYESAKNGTIEQFKQNLQMMLQQAITKIKALQNPSLDVINILKNIYNTPPSNQTQNSIFGGSQMQQKPAFGNTTQPSGIFGGVQTQSVFAANKVPNPIFGEQQNIQNKSIFAQASTQASNSMFGAPFPQNTTQPQQNIFQQQPPPFVAAQQPPSTSHFGSVNQFTAQQFGDTTSNKPAAFQHTQSIFGNFGMQQQEQNVFGGAPHQTKPNQDFYSKLEDLTEEEIKWFQSDNLDMLKIPEKPPTYEMCFKVQ
ncbi:nucleoporin NUP42 [Tribolium castaneum]|uniref:Nucleoporin NUP42 n=1 Tax=Tribolium castaneum TaxID=7070 RepID=D6WVA8_TRICA|nr:PREDICTED: nucleoporin-like protein 2 [Tribolium castaneum]EFA09097.2 Nucleoporin-like protein 2 [Tribolium castaneum]|eukprot:XP_975152.2 PREDICTED: nucleoporin-like protein 2 [Tribolium castaneum]